MSGQSPSSMMRSAQRPARKRQAPPRRRRRLWPFLVLAIVIIALPVGWNMLWSYAASIANEALAGWINREAALGRVYSCGSQTTGGFPFDIVMRCDKAAAAFNSNRPPFNVNANGFTFSAQLFRPTLLRGEIDGPVTVADPGGPPIFTANWSKAQVTLLGLPPEPERATVALAGPRLDRPGANDGGMIFQADQLDVDGRIIQGSARSNPVIEASAKFAAATAPRFHPLLAEPLTGEIDAVMRGFKDFSPKPWPALFREMQASGGGIEIRSLHVERADAVVVGNGTLSVNPHGKLDGELEVTVSGVENIVPLLGIDQLIGQGVDRLTGGTGSPTQGLGMLDRLLPGLGGAVREGANSSVIESIKKMGKPAQIDNKPAIALPLRVEDGIIYVGVIPVGTVPALF
jgi:hypothetical protein